MIMRYHGVALGAQACYGLRSCGGESSCVLQSKPAASLTCQHRGTAPPLPVLPAGGSGLLPPALTHRDGSMTRIYPLGSWFTPCGYADDDCHLDFQLQRVVGSVNLTQMVRVGELCRWGAHNA